MNCGPWVLLDLNLKKERTISRGLAVTSALCRQTCCVLSDFGTISPIRRKAAKAVMNIVSIKIRLFGSEQTAGSAARRRDKICLVIGSLMSGRALRLVAAPASFLTRKDVEGSGKPCHLRTKHTADR